ncbi:MAG: hypothetical protein H5T62_15275 [Anaerolineae bacterium]|nr:hypothetical protein [Anaerolineae bacterium]
MPSRPTKVIRWNVTCEDHGHQAITYVLAGDTYGRLLGTTPHHELAEFNSWEDPVFDEVGELVDELLRRVGRESWAAECFQRILGVACDPAPSGHLYDFTGKIWCPICGSPNVHYRPDDPFQFEVIELAHVTHQEWRRLSEAEKRVRIREALQEAGCLP